MKALLAPLFSSLLVIGVNHASAAVSETEAARLGKDLTPVGAERAGNADGSIPAWSGGMRPEDYPARETGRFLDNPFDQDPVLYQVNNDNMDQYREFLTDGQQALLQAFPKSWYYNVYQTRRTASYPQQVYDALRSNAEHAEVVTTGRGGIRNAQYTSPFPIPSSGVEVVWNHLMRYRGLFVKRFTSSITPVGVDGYYRLALFSEELGFIFSFPKDDSVRQAYPDLTFVHRHKAITPPSLAGAARLRYEFLHNGESRKPSTWAYNTGLKRVFRTPFIGYDQVALETDGLRIQDEWDMYNGSPGRFDWKLLGKRELLIPYNAYKLHSSKLSDKDIVRPNHINPKHGRYELHRVWVVEGTTKYPYRPNIRQLDADKRGHLYAKRRFYIDEDSWQIAVTEAWDHDGKLWRASEGHIVNFYDQPLVWTTLEVFHDFKAGRYTMLGLDNDVSPPEFKDKVNIRQYSPNALQYFVR